MSEPGEKFVFSQWSECVCFVKTDHVMITQSNIKRHITVLMLTNRSFSKTKMLTVLSKDPDASLLPSELHATE